MPNLIDAKLLEFDDWIFRYRPATGNPSRLIILLHGWTGDEDSMWVFTRKISSDAGILAPRGPYRALEGGYSWFKPKPEATSLPDLEEFRPSVLDIVKFLEGWSRKYGVNVDKFDVIGFSQGAAFAFALAFLHPGHIQKMAILSGFLPGGGKTLLAEQPLVNQTIFIFHGRQDKILPVEKARKTVKLLEDSGVQVKFCESDSGHKVSLDCFTGLAEFFA